MWGIVSIVGCGVFLFCALVSLYSISKSLYDSEKELPKDEMNISHNRLSEVREMVPLNITLWSSDFHISPVAELKANLQSMGVRFIDKSLSGACHITHTCEKDLRVINSLNGIELTPCPNSLRSDFYLDYRKDNEFTWWPLFEPSMRLR